MFNVKTTGFDKPLFGDLERDIRLLPDTLEDEALNFAVEFEDELIAIYNEAPPRGNTRFKWSDNPEKNKKGRGWWFWQLALGNIPTDGKHYIRQQKPPRGGYVTVERKGDTVTIAIGSKWKKSNVIYGNLNATNNDTRVPGHKLIWELAYPKYLKAKQVLLPKLFDRVLNRRFGAS
jgi:hypothetical protein